MHLDNVPLTLKAIVNEDGVEAVQFAVVDGEDRVPLDLPEHLWPAADEIASIVANELYLRHKVDFDFAC